MPASKVKEVLVPPCLVGSGVCRLVELEDRLVRIEGWIGGRWVPSDVSIVAVLHGTPVADPSLGSSKETELKFR